MARGDRVPLVRAAGLAAVTAQINGTLDIRLIVDTGAERIIVSRNMAQLLGFDLARPARAEALQGIGRSAPMPVVTLDRVQVGASAASRLIASVYDLPASFGVDGLLGLNFLRRFRVSFEFDTRTLVLREPPRRVSTGAGSQTLPSAGRVTQA